MEYLSSILEASKKKLRLRSSSRRRSASRADPSSFSYVSGSSSDSSVTFKETPKSVLVQSFDPIHREVFNLFDRDGDGKITRQEVELLFHRLGGRIEPPSQEEVGMIISEADVDGDGCISIDEFGAFSSALGPARPTELREAFDCFDSDGDGRISAEELFGIFTELGDSECTLEDCQRMIEGVDREKKGFVGFEDFERMMMRGIEI